MSVLPTRPGKHEAFTAAMIVLMTLLFLCLAHDWF
jgi:hypothetical protein